MNICKRVVGLEGDKVCTSGASDLFRTHTYVSTCFILLPPGTGTGTVSPAGLGPTRRSFLGSSGELWVRRPGWRSSWGGVKGFFVPAAVNIASLLFTSGRNTSIMCHWSEPKLLTTPIFPGAAETGVSGCRRPNHCHCFSITALPDAHGSGLQSL